MADAVEAQPGLELVSGVSRSDPTRFSSVCGGPRWRCNGRARRLHPCRSCQAERSRRARASRRSRRGLEWDVGGATTRRSTRSRARARCRRGCGRQLLGDCRTVASLRRRGGAPPRDVGGDRLRERHQAGCSERHVARARRTARRCPSAGLRVPLDDVHGAREARGATVAGTQVHSVRLPSFTVSTEAVFAADGERLSIRHDAGESPAPYVAGTLLAIRAVTGRVGPDPGPRPAAPRLGGMGGTGRVSRVPPVVVRQGRRERPCRWTWPRPRTRSHDDLANPSEDRGATPVGPSVATSRTRLSAPGRTTRSASHAVGDERPERRERRSTRLADREPPGRSSPTASATSASVTLTVPCTPSRSVGHAVADTSAQSSRPSSCRGSGRSPAPLPRATQSGTPPSPAQRR